MYILIKTKKKTFFNSPLRGFISTVCRVLIDFFPVYNGTGTGGRARGEAERLIKRQYLPCINIGRTFGIRQRRFQCNK